MTERARPESRSAYRHFLPIQTRWADNDAYGHVNNVVYYAWFDTVVNEYLIAQRVLDVARSEVVGLVVETRCSFFSELAFPQRVAAGLRVAHIGRSSVRYEIGLFAEAAGETSAHGYFVHVYVDRAARTPVPLPAPLRAALERIHA